MRIPDNIDWQKYIEGMSMLEASVTHWGNHWEHDLQDLLEQGDQITGIKLPWAKTHNCFRLRPGELSIWAGINGHRKSMLLGQVMLWAAKESKVCIASLEMEPRKTLFRMAKQAAGCFPSKSFSKEFTDWCEDRICIYDQLDTVADQRIFALVYYAAKELGCGHIVIDSLSKCGIGDDDYAGEKRFVDKLQWLAKSLKVHIHLVCHMRKGMSEDRVPNKFDVKGTGGITDLADNVLIVWKDKRKEQAKKKLAAHQTLTDEENEAMARPDQKLIVEKQRHGDHEGGFLLWFHDPSMQFIPKEDGGAIPFKIPTKQNSIPAPGWDVYSEAEL